MRLTCLCASSSRRAVPLPRGRAPSPRSCRCAAVNTEVSVEAHQIQKEIVAQLEGLNRGIFGVQAEKKAVIHGLIEKLETLNPVSAPVQHLDLVDGRWVLRYSTITIMGTKRSKLGLREFVSIGEMHQTINVAESTAVNTVDFRVTGFGLVKGQLRLSASFSPASDTRVNVVLDEAVLEPEQLQKLFQKHYDLLLTIFNPEGWLEITYVDKGFRIGRDGTGHLFVLERCADA